MAKVKEEHLDTIQVSNQLKQKDTKNNIPDLKIITLHQSQSTPPTNKPSYTVKHSECLLKVKRRKSLSTQKSFTQSSLRQCETIHPIISKNENVSVFHFLQEDSFDSCDAEILQLLKREHEDDLEDDYSIERTSCNVFIDY